MGFRAHKALNLLVVVALVGVFGVSASTPPSLNAYNAPLNISVSGLSAGGYFSVQMHVTYSSKVFAGAVFAGGPYHCAEGILETALSTCMMGLPPPENFLYIDATLAKAQDGYIDAVSNLKNSQVFLFSGMDDHTVYRAVVDHLASYYEHFTGNSSTIQYVTDVGAGHCQPTLSYGNPCSETASPFIGACDFDGAGAVLQQFYGALNPPNRGNLTGQLLEFNQYEFVGNGISMPATGFVFVPAACAKGAQCQVHVSFHGCLQDYASVGLDYIAHGGYNDWADTNNLIILYPQVSVSPLIPYNPNGCWDWWGYTGFIGYDDKRGAQMSGVWKMIEQVTSGASQ